MKLFIILLVFFLMVCCSSLSMKPHKTSVTYGVAETEKDDGKDSIKESLTVKQEFLWEE